MSEPAEIDLTVMQREALRSVFARYADRFERVDVYGSRATGRARPGSDVDLVIHGGDARLPGRILAELEESDLSIFADVQVFEHIGSTRLREEIVRDARTLFVANDLRDMKDASEPPRPALH